MKLPAASCGVSKQAELRRSQPAFALKSFGAVRHAIHPWSKLQGILAKANKKRGVNSCIQERSKKGDNAPIKTNLFYIKRL